MSSATAFMGFPIVTLSNVRKKPNSYVANIQFRGLSIDRNCNLYKKHARNVNLLLIFRVKIGSIIPSTITNEPLNEEALLSETI